MKGFPCGLSSLARGESSSSGRCSSLIPKRCMISSSGLFISFKSTGAVPVVVGEECSCSSSSSLGPGCGAMPLGRSSSSCCIISIASFKSGLFLAAMAFWAFAFKRSILSSTDIFCLSCSRVEVVFVPRCPRCFEACISNLMASSRALFSLVP